jgi:acyl carrier protein
MDENRESVTVEEIKKSLLDELGTILARELSPGDSTVPLRELGVNSLSLVEMFVVIENRFGVKLMDSGLKREDFASIDALSTAIRDILS